MLARLFSTCLLTASIVANAAHSADAPASAKAVLMTTKGETIGIVNFVDKPNGILITGELRNLPLGEHGFHVHERGSCEAGFSGAGDHFAPEDRQHGFSNPAGYHAGDLPNIFVDSDGVARFHFFTPRLTVGEGENTIMDDDGSAIIVHADADTYLEEAAAGDRIACGVISGEP